MKIGIVSDHKGYELKNSIINKLSSKYELIDCGPYDNNSVDYPTMGAILGKKIINDEVDFGICICGTGIGISIVLNKFKTVRCALIHNKKEASLAHEHNNANCLAFKGSTSIKKAISMIESYINTPFSKDERHIKRVNQILELEKNNEH